MKDKEFDEWWRRVTKEAIQRCKEDPDQLIERMKSQLEKRRDTMPIDEYVAYLGRLQARVQVSLQRVATEWTHYDPKGNLARHDLLMDAKLVNGVIQREIEALILRSHREHTEPAERIEFAKDNFRVIFRSGRFKTLAITPRLEQATDEQRQNWRVIGKGLGIRWPDIDEDIKL